jgi:hypothetical protein
MAQSRVEAVDHVRKASPGLGPVFQRTRRHSRADLPVGPGRCADRGQSTSFEPTAPGHGVADCGPIGPAQHAPQRGQYDAFLGVDVRVVRCSETRDLVPAQCYRFTGADAGQRGVERTPGAGHDPVLVFEAGKCRRCRPRNGRHEAAARDVEHVHLAVLDHVVPAVQLSVPRPRRARAPSGSPSAARAAAPRRAARCGAAPRDRVGHRQHGLAAELEPVLQVRAPSAALPRTAHGSRRSGCGRRPRCASTLRFSTANSIAAAMCRGSRRRRCPGGNPASVRRAARMRRRCGRGTARPVRHQSAGTGRCASRCSR